METVDLFAMTKFDEIEEKAQELIFKVKAAAQARIIQRQYSSGSGAASTPSPQLMIRTTDTVIAIGASTGGIEALRVILEALPPETPPILITQHMPEKFTKTFAKRLNDLCQITVKEAENGDSLLVGQALIAPGNHHMTMIQSGSKYRVMLNQKSPVNRHRPSVDVMFQSVAKYGGAQCIGVILTGMGQDGAAGILEMKRAGAHTIAQDEMSCVVFGMPKEAIKLGGVDKILPLPHIPTAILEYVKSLTANQA